LLRKLGDVNLGLSLLLRGHCCVVSEEKGFENVSGCGEEEEEEEEEKEEECEGEGEGRVECIYRRNKSCGERVRLNLCPRMSDFER